MSSSSSSSSSSSPMITLMPATTLSVSIAAPPSRVFDYVRRAENLDRWNTNAFCISREVHHLPHSASQQKVYHHRVETPYGPVRLTMASNEELGVADRYLLWGDSDDESKQAEEGREVIMPTRVVPNGQGSEYIITVFHPPAFLKQQEALPHEEWLSQWKADMFLLKSILESGSSDITASSPQRL